MQCPLCAAPAMPQVSWPMSPTAATTLSQPSTQVAVYTASPLSLLSPRNTSARQYRYSWWTMKRRQVTSCTACKAAVQRRAWHARAGQHIQPKRYCAEHATRNLVHKTTAVQYYAKELQEALKVLMWKCQACCALLPAEQDDPLLRSVSRCTHRVQHVSERGSWLA